MATIPRAHRMTADEFFDSPDVPELAELVDGEVFELTTPPPVHGWIARTVQRALDAFVLPRRLGEVFQDNIPYRLGEYKVRVPDVSLIRAERVPGPPPDHGGWPLAPDLVVEVVSPSETHADIRRKVADYLEAGASVVWLIDPRERGVEVHTPEAAMRWIDAAGIMDGGEVLPGFTLPVADVFAGVPAPEPKRRRNKRP